MSKALQKTYDGIVIGAGHHGLILASYLASAGLDILLVERRLTYGGGLCTREVTLPGFYHNLHSINHFHITETPWFKDLGLDERVTYITPRYEFGQAHRDGIGAGARTRSRGVGRQYRALLQERRADLPRLESQGREDHARDLPARALRRAAAAGRARGAACAHRARARIPRRGATASRSTWCGELFENEHVQLLFLFKVSLFGTWLTDTLSKTSPMGSVIRAFDLESGYQLCQGGSFNLARGLMETFIAAGGTFQPQVDIERIVIENGTRDRHRACRRPHGARAAVRGLDPRRASDLREPDRARAVAGGVPQEARRFPIHASGSLFGLHLALNESPRFAAEKFDPNINRALKWSRSAPRPWRTCSPRIRTCMAGRVPTIVQFGSGPLSLLDPTQAPPGKHTTYCWHVMPLDPDIGGAELRGLQGGVRRQDRRGASRAIART